MPRKNILLTALFILSLTLTGCAGQDALPEDARIDYEDDVKPLIAEENIGHKVRGSCNAIAEKSTCVDYIGSMWKENETKLNCQGVGIWSGYACPYSEIGGCLSGGDTITEVVLWNYNEGANAVTPEDAQYMAMACNKTAGGRWVTPQDLLSQ
jgi:hypothetical protein